MHVVHPVDAISARKAYLSSQAYRRNTLRLFASAILLAIGLVGLVHLPRIWTPSNSPTTKVLGIIEVYDTGGKSVNAESSFADVLEVSRGACPQDRLFVILGDVHPLFMLVDYYMYPRKIVRVMSSDTFDLEELKAQGGCIGAYGEAVQRVVPFKQHLNEISCSNYGCVYKVQ